MLADGEQRMAGCQLPSVVGDMPANTTARLPKDETSAAFLCAQPASGG